MYIENYGRRREGRREVDIYPPHIPRTAQAKVFDTQVGEYMEDDLNR